MFLCFLSVSICLEIKLDWKSIQPISQIDKTAPNQDIFFFMNGYFWKYAEA